MTQKEGEEGETKQGKISSQLTNCVFQLFFPFPFPYSSPRVFSLIFSSISSFPVLLLLFGSLLNVLSLTRLEDKRLKLRSIKHIYILFVQQIGNDNNTKNHSIRTLSLSWTTIDIITKSLWFEPNASITVSFLLILSIVRSISV